MPEATLYQAEWCPHSHKVRHALTCHGVSYRIVNVPAAQDERDDLHNISGQRQIPVLEVDGATLSDTSEILRVIAERWPREEQFVREHERKAIPVLIAHWRHQELDEVEPRVVNAFRQQGIQATRAAEPAAVELAPASRETAHDVLSIHDLSGEWLGEMVKCEPRTMALLPVRLVFSRHPHGVVAQVAAVSRQFAQLRNTQLSRLCTDFQERVLAALGDAGAELNASRAQKVERG